MLIRLHDKPTAEEWLEYSVGYLAVKEASEAVASYSLSGRLYGSKSGWLLLSVPNAIVRGLFDALDEPGIELPPNKSGNLNAHISVARPSELEDIGGIDKITERGKSFRFQLGPIKTVEPAGWKEMSKVWFVSIDSPELRALRKSYGLSGLPKRGEEELPFHMTVAVRRKGVLYENDRSKAASVEEKLADLNYVSEALKGEPIRYDMQQGIAQNMFDHLSKVQARGTRAVSDAASLDRMKSNLDPNFGLEQFTRALSGHNNPNTPSAADQFLLGFPINDLRSAF